MFWAGVEGPSRNMDERGVLCADEIDLEEALDDLEILKRAMTLVYVVEVGMGVC